MNQGEVEWRSCGVDTSNCFDYFRYLDVSSTGRIGNLNRPGGNGDYFGVIDLAVSPYYVTMAQQGVCSWQADWGLPAMTTATYNNIVNWAAYPYNGTVLSTLRLPTSPYVVAVSRGSLETQRCPSWQICEGSTSTVHSAILVATDTTLSALPSTTSAFNYDSHLPCGRLTSQACMGLLCGQPAVARRTDNAVADWWTCGGPNCNTVGGNWVLACRSSSNCTVTVADSDAYLVNIPPAIQSQIVADGPDIDLGHALAN